MDSQLASPPRTAVAPFVNGLATHGDRPALIAPGGRMLTYRELADRVSTFADHLGTTRRLVLLAVSNDVESVIAYLACLHAGHPVVLTARGGLDALVERYDPDVVALSTGVRRRREGSAHRLHSELALLLSTSGSTGSPKLVRLSAANLAANATAIGDYLGIRADDRAMLSLPMHYCYGLSVVNSNLARGAALVLTERSVLDDDYWSEFHQHRATSLHGVPYTFDLLDRVGFENMALPSLRYVTQAGGRLAPECVRKYARVADRDGWQFFLMYGQTEATARMAYLPPRLASTHPGAIGIAIPGGDFALRVDGHPDRGELIYHGPNVMLGYAHGPADLALGRTVDSLATGDIARRTPDGLYEIVGRKNRFIKPFGHRIDLDQAERLLREAGHDGACAGDDHGLIVAITGGDTRTVAAALAARLGLSRESVQVHHFPELPRLPSGKIDYPAIEHHARETPDTPTESVRQAFVTVFNRPDIRGDDTFVTLGGDSLSYVHMATTLEKLLGHLPATWPTTPVRELETLAPRRRTLGRIETNILLRAAAITLVAGSHVGAFHILGGAHLLLILSGWAFARFGLAAGNPDRLAPRILRTATKIAIPAMLWLLWRSTVTDDIRPANVLLLNNYLHQGATGYWFIEVLVQILVVLAAAFAIPGVRRYEQRHGFTIAAIALAAALALSPLADDSSGFPERIMSTHGVAWFFALGWLAHQATTGPRKLAVLALALALVPGYFGDPRREAVITVGLFLLILLTQIPLPRTAIRVVALIANASLSIYLTHWAIYPVLLPHLPPVAVVVLCLAAGIAISLCIQNAPGMWRRIKDSRWGWAIGAR